VRRRNFLGDNEIVGGQEFQNPDQGVFVQIVEYAGSLKKFHDD
jgi:hypothetical protein